MRIEVFKELQPYSIGDLQSILSLNEEYVRELLKSLSLMNITRKLSKNASKIELEELFGTENLIDINTKFESEMFLFKYVGMLTVNDVCLIIYPKYMDTYQEDKGNGYIKLKQLISVIRKYQSKNQNQSTILGDENEHNSLAITLALIEDYLEHGLYSNDRQIIEENGSGEVLWEKTLNESTVYFSNGIPVYLDLFTLNQESNEKDFFRQLHRIVLSGACKKLEEVLNIIGIEPINLTDVQLSALGGEEYIINKINQELGVQFVTRKQFLLKLIKNYITNESGSQIDERISFVGTNAFNLVWEDVCSEVYGDCINMSIQEMGLQFKDDKKFSTTLADVVEKPKWTHFKSRKTHEASKTLTPDIITITDDHFSIYDAKYYQIKLDENGVANNPGVGDITKQYLYELAYKEFIKENGLVMAENAFLFPYEGDENITIGAATMEMFQNISNLSEIKVILLPAHNLYAEYLNYQ